jgi:hypothetical protein
MLLNDECQVHIWATLWSRQSFPLGATGFIQVFRLFVCWPFHSGQPTGLQFSITYLLFMTSILDQIQSCPAHITSAFLCTHAHSFSGLQSGNGKGIMPTLHPLPAHHQWHTGSDTLDKYPISILDAFRTGVLYCIPKVPSYPQKLLMVCLCVQVPVSVSWDHLLTKLLILEFFCQHQLLEALK